MLASLATERESAQLPVAHVLECDVEAARFMGNGFMRRTARRCRRPMIAGTLDHGNEGRHSMRVRVEAGIWVIYPDCIKLSEWDEEAISQSRGPWKIFTDRSDWQRLPARRGRRAKGGATVRYQGHQHSGSRCVSTNRAFMDDCAEHLSTEHSRVALMKLGRRSRRWYSIIATHSSFGEDTRRASIDMLMAACDVVPL